MGLSLSVGYLADVTSNDPEGSAVVTDYFNRLSEALMAAGQQAHREPVELDESLRFSCQMWGYSGLHHLRRFAAYAAFGMQRPQPTKGEATKDPVLQRYYDEVTDRAGFIGRLFRSQSGDRLGFQHLIVHSDAEGYYVPQEFRPVIFPSDRLEIPGAMIGSVQQLQGECRRLAQLLEIPEGLDAESDEVWKFAESPESGAAEWQRYGIESFSCVRLLAACDASLSTGAALVFC